MLPLPTRITPRYCEEGEARRGNLPAGCDETGNLAADLLRRIHLSFRENPRWKQEIAAVWGSRAGLTGMAVFDTF